MCVNPLHITLSENSEKNVTTIGFYLHCIRKSCIINTMKKRGGDVVVNSEPL